MSTEYAEKCVARGSKFLDKKLPGWDFDINLRTLDLSEGCKCVLGQLACDIVPRERWADRLREGGGKPFYSEARTFLRITGKRERTLGFVSTVRRWNSYSLLNGEVDDAASYNELTDAWKAEVKRRRKAAKAAKAA